MPAERTNTPVRDFLEHRYGGHRPEYYDFPRTRYPVNRYQAALNMIRPGNRVLDVGSGDGLFLYNLRNSFSELYGIDIARNRTDAAVAGFATLDVKATFVAGAIEQGLPWRDGFFDTVVWIHVIQQVPNIWGALAEIARVTRPGGQFVTTASNIAYVRRVYSLLMGKFPATSALDEGFAVEEGAWYDDGTMHYFTFSSLRKHYRKFGFEPEQATGFGRLGRCHALWPRLLSGGICLSGRKRG